MNKILCFFLSLMTLVVLLGCEKPPEEDIQSAIDSITTPPEDTTDDPIPDISGDDTNSNPPLDEDPPPEEPPSDPGPDESSSRYSFQYTPVQIWSFIDNDYVHCISHQRLFVRFPTNEACFYYLGEVAAPAGFDLYKIRFRNNLIKIVWTDNAIRIRDWIALSANRDNLTVTTDSISRPPSEPSYYGNIRMIIPITFENITTLDFDGYISWSKKNRIIILKGPSNTLRIFAY